MNPLSYVMLAVRELLAGDPGTVGTSLLAIVGMAVVLGAWALTGVRSAERAGG